MPARIRILRALLPMLATLLLLPCAAARAASPYERVSVAYTQGGGHLDPCAFSQADLEAARAGIPKVIAKFVPDLRKAIRDGIAAHAHGDCKGRRPSTSTSAGGVGAATPPAATTSPGIATTPPATPTATTPTTPAPPATATTPAQPQTSAAPAPDQLPPSSTSTATPHHRSRVAIAVALIALGALLALALALWGWARLRGWDPVWAARARHAWGEAGYRTTTTWAEFTDWLRLGR